MGETAVLVAVALCAVVAVGAVAVVVVAAAPPVPAYAVHVPGEIPKDGITVEKNGTRITVDWQDAEHASRYLVRVYAGAGLEDTLFVADSVLAGWQVSHGVPYTIVATPYGDHAAGPERTLAVTTVYDEPMPPQSPAQEAGPPAETGPALDLSALVDVIASLTEIMEEYSLKMERLEAEVAGLEAEVAKFSGAAGAHNAMQAGGGVSLDRAAYPIPFSGDSFMDANGKYLEQRDLVAHIRVDDAALIASAEKKGLAPSDLLSVIILRGGESRPLDVSGARAAWVGEDAESLVLSLPISYDDGPGGQIISGDVLRAQYGGADGARASPAVFGLSDGVLQSDKSEYIIGTDIILSLDDPDLNLDGDAAESYGLDLIKWSSEGHAVSLGGDPAFSPEPAVLLETGRSTGIFQAVITVPPELDGSRTWRGAGIELAYADYGPSGASHVGNSTADAALKVYASHFGASVELDREAYTWTDAVRMTIVAPGYNLDPETAESIGGSGAGIVRVSTSMDEITGHVLAETGPDTGVFEGEVVLIGFDHNADGDVATGYGNGGLDNPQQGAAIQGGVGPVSGHLRAQNDDLVVVAFEYSEEDTLVDSALVHWNVGKVRWLGGGAYPAAGAGTVMVVDPDMNLDPREADGFAIGVRSGNDAEGISLKVTETGPSTGIFEGTAYFTMSGESSGSRLRVAENDTVTAEYADNTLPDPYTRSDWLAIAAHARIGPAYPPPASGP